MTGDYVCRNTLNKLVVLCAWRNNVRFVSANIAQLEIFGALESQLAHCDRPLGFEQNGSTVEATRLDAHREVRLQRMKIQRMIMRTAGL